MRRGRGDVAYHSTLAGHGAYSKIDFNLNPRQHIGNDASSQRTGFPGPI